MWIGDSLETLAGFPPAAKRALGYGLRQLQNGEISPIAKHMTGLGAGVFELVDRTGGDAYRVICATKLGDVVYVVDTFKKKSKKGSKTPREIVERIERRLKAARAMEKKG